MVLVDSSVWIDYFRGADTPAAEYVRALIPDRLTEVATTEPVVMEILAGARNEHALRQLEAFTNGLTLLPVAAAQDYYDAAALFRAARRRGATVRKLVDCLIAAVALRHGATLVHDDADFDAIAAVVPLQTYRPS